MVNDRNIEQYYSNDTRSVHRNPNDLWMYKCSRFRRSKPFTTFCIFANVFGMYKLFLACEWIDVHDKWNVHRDSDQRSRL